MRVSRETFLQEVNTATEEINNGIWQGKDESNEFSEKIMKIFRENSGYYLYEFQEYLSDKPFVSNVTNLIQAMKHLNQTTATTQAIEKISNILNSSSPVPGSEEDLTKMKDKVRGLEIFRKLKEQNFPNIPKMLAKWIKFGHTPISEFNFSKEELLEIAPFLTYFCIDTRKFTNEEIHEIISKCNMLEDLKIESDSLTDLPTTWPSNLVSLDLSMCHNLKAINELPEGLRKILCMSCGKLTRLPKKLPQSMEIFNCGGSEYVSELPILNEGLKKIDFSRTRVEQIPKTPSTLTEMDLRECSLCEEWPEELSESLLNIYASGSGITKLPPKFPPKLTLTVSWCPNLTLPKNLDSISLPPGAKIIR